MAIAKVNGVNQHSIAKYSGTTNETITKLLGSIIWANAFLSFDGVDDKAEFTIDSGFITALCGESGKIGDNTSITMWIKPTWATSGSGVGFAPRHINFCFLGAPADVWESIRLFYQLTNSSGVAQNRIWATIRSNTNAKDEDYEDVDEANSITGTGTGGTDYWQTTNPSGEGWVHLCFVRDSADWKIYWNGNPLTMSNSNANTMDIDNSVARVLQLGFRDTDDKYYKYGIRDFGIWNVALNDARCETLYNNGKFFDHRTAGFGNLVVYYPFHADGTDFSGNSDNITLTGGTITSI